MGVVSFITEAKEKIHRQEKFARENFNGLNEIGAELLITTKKIDKLWKQYNKAKLYKEERDKDKELYDMISAEVIKLTNSQELVFTILDLKMTTIIGHALNGNSTKTLKDIIQFMDNYGINDKAIQHRDLSKLLINKQVKMGSSILHCCAFIAAQIDDIAFINFLEKFAEKNKGRTNIFKNWGYPYRDYGDMDTYSLTSIEDTEIIAFVALLNGSEQIYKYYNSDITDTYVMKYIKNNGKYGNQYKLTSKEVSNMIQLKPTLIDTIAEYMPENLPDNIVDIFLF